MFQFILLVAFLKEGASLKCYQCIPSKDKQTCIDQQKVINCGLSHSKPACMSNSYGTTMDDKPTSFFVKKCYYDLDSCWEYCRKSAAMSDVENCKVDCCQTDNCNKDDNFNKVAVFEQKSKRSNNPHDSSNREPILAASRLVVLINFLVISFLRYTVLR